MHSEARYCHAGQGSCSHVGSQQVDACCSAVVGLQRRGAQGLRCHGSMRCSRSARAGFYSHCCTCSRVTAAQVEMGYVTHHQAVCRGPGTLNCWWYMRVCHSPTDMECVCLSSCPPRATELHSAFSRQGNWYWAAHPAAHMRVPRLIHCQPGAT